MKTDIRSIDADITASLAVIRGALWRLKMCAPLVDWPPIDDAMVTVETFAAVALRVFAKTNPSKVRSEARNVEIQARLPRAA